MINPSSLGTTSKHLLKPLLQKVANVSAKNMDNIWIWTSVAGWVSSSLFQCIGIANNKEYSKEHKKYMLWQEIGDAAVNILSFLGLTLSAKMFAGKLVSTGKVASEKMIKHMNTRGVKDFFNKNMLSRGSWRFNIEETVGFDRIKKEYGEFSAAVRAIGALVGGVISSNLITPYARNKIASYRRNLYLNKVDKTQNNNPVLDIPTNKPNTTTKPAPTLRPANPSVFDTFRGGSTGMRV